MMRIVTKVAFILYIKVISEAVHSLAVFEVDLLQYEALPNKCCDGYKGVHIGPLKCNECDPYFWICLKQLPSGTNHCVKTTRENNVHSKDLTNGNIKPNHLSIPLDDWQGSLLVDVDIKDYDSINNDDDIDHLVYTYTGVPDPSTHTVTINGTKVRLTVALRIFCGQNYFGNDCTAYCTNDSRSYCDNDGQKHCKPGYTGTNCTLLNISTTSPSTSELPAIIDSQTSYVPEIKESGHSKTTKTAELQFVTSQNQPEIKESSQNKFPNTAKPQFMTSQNQQTVPRRTVFSEITSVDHSENSFTTESVRLNDHTHPYLEQDTKNSTSKNNIGSQTSPNNSPSVPERKGSSNTSDKPTNTATADSVTVEGATSSNVQETMTTMTFTKATTTRVYIPEPIELYSCNIKVQGHKTGVHLEIIPVITTALSTYESFSPMDLLGVHAISSTFELTDNGYKVTDVSYVVNLNGQVMRSESVVRILTQPHVSKVLDEQLAAKKLVQYHAQPQPDVAPGLGKSNWVSSHLPFVIVMSCVAAILLIVPVLCVLRKTHQQKKSNQSKNALSAKHFDMKMKSANPRESYDEAYSIENPVYDFESNKMSLSNSYA